MSRLADRRLRLVLALSLAAFAIVVIRAVQLQVVDAAALSRKAVSQQRGVEVAYHDPYVPVIKPSREHSHWAGTKSTPWLRETLAAFDLVLIATNHACVNYNELAEWNYCIVDSRNAMAAVETKTGQVWKT